MARPRKPTKHHELSGAFDKNPKRRRGRVWEPIGSASLGEKPERLPAKVSAAWDELVSMCHPGLLIRADRMIVELAARMTVRCRSDEGTAADATQLRCCLQQLGMTPAARSMVTIPEPEKTNDFAAA